MTLSEKEVRAKVEDEGAVHVLITFEMVGKPKEHVIDTLKTYVRKLEEDPAVGLIRSHTEDAVELEEEEGFFSAFSEIEMTVPALESLTHLSVNLMPASIEILAPDEFTFSARDLMNWENDLLARLHEISQSLRNERQKVNYLSKNMHALIRNSVTILLTSGPKDTKTLSRLTGIGSERLEKSLEQFAEDGVITNQDDQWQLSSPKK